VPSRVLLHQGVPYHPAQERRGAGKAESWTVGLWSGKVMVWWDVGVWMCDMGLGGEDEGGLVPGVEPLGVSGAEERREGKSQAGGVHAWCDLLWISHQESIQKDVFAGICASFSPSFWISSSRCFTYSSSRFLWMLAI